MKRKTKAIVVLLLLQAVVLVIMALIASVVDVGILPSFLIGFLGGLIPSFYLWNRFWSWWFAEKRREYNDRYRSYGEGPRV